MSEPLDLPLSSAQRGLWLDLKVRPLHPERFNIATSASIRGAFDPESFRRAIELMVQRHSALRARFVVDDRGEPAQRISPNAAGHYELRQFDTVADAEQWVNEDVLIPFASLEEPLCRFVLCRCGEHEWLWYAKYHHLVIDGQGLALLRQDVCAIYAALLEGQTPAARVDTFGEFLRDDAEYRLSAAHATDRNFWRNVHTQSAAPASLRPRAPAELNRLAARSHALSGRSGLWIERLASELSVDPTHVLIAACALFLSCLSGERTVAVGLPVHGRSRQHQQLVAFCSNILPLRLSIDFSGTMQQLIARISEQIVGALDHRRFRFEDSQHELDANAIAAVVNVMRFPSAIEFDMGPARARIAIRAAGPIHGLSFLFYGRREAPDLSVAIDANAHWGDATELSSIRASFMAFLDRLASLQADDAIPTDALDASSRIAVQHWSSGPALPTPHSTLAELFAASVREHPDHTALRWHAGSMSYRELDRRSAAVAALLQRDLEPRSVVAVFMQRGPEAIVSLLGILKANCIYLPIDPENPPARANRMLEGASVACVLTEHHRTERAWATLRGPRARGVTLEEPLRSENFVARTVDCSDVAYIIYTSGSTGEPKAALNRHDALANLAVAQADAFQITSQSRVLQLARLGFDASLAEIGATLIRGGCLYLASGDLSASVADLPALLRRERITTATIPPALLALLPDSPLPDLQTLIVAGEACPLDLVRRWARGRRLINAYGPTESAVCATWGELTESSPVASIGRPLANARTQVMNANGRPVPPGCTGELWIGGTPVGLGYLNDASLTASRFVVDESGDRWYRTGDLARWLPDGTLEFMGRSDSQTKIRGFRVELGEIEAALRTHPCVTASAAVVRRRRGRAVIDAYVACMPDACTADSLRRHVKAALPDFMMPATFTMLDALPLSFNGKLDRDALPTPRVAPTRSEENGSGDTRSRVGRILQDALGVGELAHDNSFFDLGGDSLVAIQVIMELRRAFGIEFPADRFFLQPDVASIAAQVDAMKVHLSARTEQASAWQEFFR